MLVSSTQTAAMRRIIIARLTTATTSSAERDGRKHLVSTHPNIWILRQEVTRLRPTVLRPLLLLLCFNHV